MHIAVAGNIGSGKSTLTRMLARHYGWTPRFEQVMNNPYLEDYYKDIKRWSFNMEVFFLKERFRDLLEISKSNKDIIQDRTIYEGVYVFTENNHRMGNLDDRDYEAYMELFGAMEEAVKLPDLMIYLHSSVPHLVKNIQKRGRSFEQEIPIEYLQNLNDLYSMETTWITNTCLRISEKSSTRLMPRFTDYLVSTRNNLVVFLRYIY